VAGVIPGSNGAYVIENPPTAPATVDLYFTNSSGQRLAHDIRSDAGPQTYNFVVACGVPNTDVTISLPDLSQVPATMQVLLVDTDAGKTMYARTLTGYTYHSSGDSSQHNFQLLISPRNIGALTVTAAAAQANQGVQVTYSVTQSCQISIHVMNLAGRAIKALVTNKTVTAGLQTELWNLTSDGGTRVPAGSYLLQIDAVTADGQQVRGLTQVHVGH
jgi:hypothetical protein